MDGTGNKLQRYYKTDYPKLIDWQTTVKHNIQKDLGHFLYEQRDKVHELPPKNQDYSETTVPSAVLRGDLPITGSRPDIDLTHKDLIVIVQLFSFSRKSLMIQLTWEEKSWARHGIAYFLDGKVQQYDAKKVLPEYDPNVWNTKTAIRPEQYLYHITRVKSEEKE